jgi:spore germination cell wall hydrolase CwlJ-like protein
MDDRTIPLALTALLLALGHPTPVEAPPPDAAAAARLAAKAPLHLRPAMMVSFAELHCLAANIYHEARGESPEGQAAVAHVTLNRVGSPGFPATICAVVHQRSGRACQFGWVCNPRLRPPAPGEAWGRAQAVAVRALAGGVDPTGGALYFQQVGTQADWATRMRRPVVIGRHVFFRLPDDPLEQRVAVAQTP